MMLYSSLFVTTAALSSLSLSAAETPLQQPEAYQQRLVDWVRSGKNGFFHPKVVWKRLGGSGPYAMHTTVDLPKGTKLLVVPRSHVLDSYKTYDECTTVARMLGEYEKGDDSFFAPYLSYLFDETPGGTGSGLLPGSWSEQGQDLLAYLLGEVGEEDGLEPSDFEKPSVFMKCGENFRADLEMEELEDPALRQQAEDAYMFYISRSWTDKMVPILDMYNHRNGASLNVESTTAHNDDDITAFALRDIKAGEQLQNTYSECMDHDCDFGELKYSYTTQMMYNDYGFLEFYPRRWQLHDVIAEVDEDLETGKKSFKWIFDSPSGTTIEWISKQLSRLRNMEEHFRKLVVQHKNSDAGGKHNNIDHESDSLLELMEGYIEVFEMALEHKSHPVGVTVEQYANDIRTKRADLNLNEL